MWINNKVAWHGWTWPRAQSPLVTKGLNPFVQSVVFNKMAALPPVLLEAEAGVDLVPIVAHASAASVQSLIMEDSQASAVRGGFGRPCTCVWEPSADPQPLLSLTSTETPAFIFALIRIVIECRGCERTLTISCPRLVLQSDPVRGTVHWIQDSECDLCRFMSCHWAVVHYDKGRVGGCLGPHIPGGTTGDARNSVIFQKHSLWSVLALQVSFYSWRRSVKSGRVQFMVC